MTGIVTRENPMRRATCNPAGAGFDRIVEIRPDPDSRIGYPSIPSFEFGHSRHCKTLLQVWHIFGITQKVVDRFSVKFSEQAIRFWERSMLDFHSENEIFIMK